MLVVATVHQPELGGTACMVGLLAWLGAFTSSCRSAYKQICCYVGVVSGSTAAGMVHRLDGVTHLKVTLPVAPGAPFETYLT